MKKTIKTILKPIVKFLLTIFLPLVKLHKKKKTIILMDRIYAAGDNGEAMYHYLRQFDEYDTYFVISKNSKDWPRLCSDPHVLEARSFKYSWIFLRTDVALFSQDMFYPHLSHIILNKLKIKSVFLQHGVTTNNMSYLYNASRGYDLVCVATNDEQNEFLRDEYGFSPEQIALTGFPRFDYIEKQESNIITIALTWRLYVKDRSVETFKSYLYHTMIENLIIKPELINLVESYGYKLRIVPHPNINMDSRIVEYLLKNADPRVEVVTNPNYKDIISDSALLITDYSSIAFDTAYLHTPVIYYQEDKDEFYSGIHSYTKGYFNFEQDGFGEVAYSYDKLLNAVKNSLENNCQMKQQYVDKATDTFEYIDKINCERVHKAIKKWL